MLSLKLPEITYYDILDKILNSEIDGGRFYGVSIDDPRNIITVTFTWESISGMDLLFIITVDDGTDEPMHFISANDFKESVLELRTHLHIMKFQLLEENDYDVTLTVYNTTC